MPHPQHLFPQRCLSSTGDGGKGLGEASIVGKGPRPWHHTQPQLSGAQPGRGRGQLCQSTSWAHTLPAMPWTMGRGGSGGRDTTPCSPWDNLRVSGVLERAAWRGGIDPFNREGNRHRVRSAGGDQEVLYAVCTTRQWGAGDLARPFHTILTQVTFPTLSPVTGLVHHTHPPRKHGDPSTPRVPGPALHSSHVLADVCACLCVCVSVSYRETVPVTQSKQMSGHPGHSYATFDVRVCHGSVTAF